MNLPFAQRALELCFKIIEQAQDFVLARFDLQEQTGWLGRGRFGHGQRFHFLGQDPSAPRGGGSCIRKIIGFRGEELNPEGRSKRA